MAAAYAVGTLRTPGGPARKDGLFEMRPAADAAAKEDVIVGCVARRGDQASAFDPKMVFAAGLPDSVLPVTIDRIRREAARHLNRTLRIAS